MLHTKFHGNRSAGSGEEIFVGFFYHIWAWRPSWSCDPYAANKLSFPLPKGLHIKFALIGLVVLEEKLFENVDGRTTTDGRRTMRIL